MSSKVAVVIPTYKDELNPLEKISLAQCRKVLKNYPLIFAAPEGKIFSYFEPGDMIAHFPPHYFQSVKTYSQLLMSPFFYETFDEFEYILIYQLDAFVFYDALKDFCALGFDYIGAPWPYYAWEGLRIPRTPRVGNGGFSLRKVSACRELLIKAAAVPNWMNKISCFEEDGFFASCNFVSDVNFTTAPVAVAQTFSMEHTPARFMRKFKNLPFGCHNWHKFDADFYVELFAQFGYDLRPFRAQMGKASAYLSINLSKFAMARLIHYAERGQSVSRYLPTKNFAAVIVIQNPDAMKILARLLLDENFLADKILIYDEKKWTDLLDEVTCEELPNLVLTVDYDKSLIAAIEKRGLTYGRHVVSFRREYLKCCEELLHRLGKPAENAAIAHGVKHGD